MTDYDIKSIRLRTGMTQAEFSKWLHIPKRTLEKWEQKISLPPSYVAELIEYKVFCTYMVSPSAPVGVQSDLDYKTLFDIMEKELDIEPSTSEFCIYRPKHGGCSHCNKPPEDDCNFRCWSRFKEFCPD